MSEETLMWEELYRSPQSDASAANEALGVVTERHMVDAALEILRDVARPGVRALIVGHATQACRALAEQKRRSSAV